VLNWNAVGVASGYRVYFRDATGTYQQFGQGVDVGPAITYQVPNLNPGTTYHFVVTSYDANAESLFSNEVCKTIS
jgi:hypothetical protein